MMSTNLLVAIKNSVDNAHFNITDYQHSSNRIKSRHFLKPAPVRQMRGKTARRNAAYTLVREYSSTVLTKQLPTGVGFKEMSSVGDALELYVKDIFCNSLHVENMGEKLAVFSNYFSYIDNASNPQSPNNPAKLLDAKLITFSQ